MYHFIGLIWDSQHLAAKEIATHLSTLLRASTVALKSTLSSEGVLIYSEPPRTKSLCVYRLAGNKGVIFGRLFPYLSDRPYLPSSFEFDDGATGEILCGGGQGLIDRFWGNYVAFLTPGVGGFACHVIRSCSGGIPCYRMRYRDVEIVFSDLGDLAPLDLPPFTLNQRYMAAYIFNHQIQVRSCGYTEITELLAGDCVSFQEKTVLQFSIWDPGKIVRSANLDDYDSAEVALRRVTRECIGAWAKVYTNVLVSLSGGFDSAVVLGCLKDSGTNTYISCFNQCMEGTADDERGYARLAAKRADVPLVERPWSNPTIDEDIFTLPMAPKPCSGHLA